MVHFLDPERPLGLTSPFSSADVAFSLRDSSKSVADDWSVGAEATRLEALSTAARIADEICMVELLSTGSVKGLGTENGKGRSARRRRKEKGQQKYSTSLKIISAVSNKILAPGPAKSEPIYIGSVTPRSS